MTEAPVLIVGAGPAGLTLARILKARNVPFEVFERDTAIHFRRQGWAIALRRYVLTTQMRFHTSTLNEQTDTILFQRHPTSYGDAP